MGTTTKDLRLLIGRTRTIRKTSSREEQMDKQRKWAEQKAARDLVAALKFNRSADVVMRATNQQSEEVPFAGKEYQQAVEDQRLQKVLKWHDIKKGFDAALTAQLGHDVGVPLLKEILNYAKNKAISPAARVMMNPRNFNLTNVKDMKPVKLDVPIFSREKPQLLLPAKSSLPPEATYTGKIPSRVLDIDAIKNRNQAKAAIEDVVADPNNYTMEEISGIVDDFEKSNNFSGTIPIKLKSSGNIFLLEGQSFRDHLKHNINPVLRHDGFKGAPLDASPEEAMQYVRDKYRELNTVSRGLMDPREVGQHNLYDKVKTKLTKKLGRNPSDLEIMDYMAVTPNRGSTGHGASGREHGEYTLYTSNGLDQAAGYALRGNSPFLVDPSKRAVYELEVPEQIPTESTYDNRFSPIANYILNNRIAFPQRYGYGYARKDLYSEYGLPYLLYNGKALNAKVDYSSAYELYLHNIGYRDKEQLIGDLKKHNDYVTNVNDLMQQIGSDINFPRITIKTTLKHPKKFFKLRRLFEETINPLVRKYEKARNEWPEHMESLLNKEFLKDVKFGLKNFKEDFKGPAEIRPIITPLTEEEYIQNIKNTVGNIPPGGFLKHKNAHSMFGTEGRNRNLTINDKRYYTPTRTSNPNATLLHYVFYNRSGDPILNIKRRVPFDEWATLYNRGSDHYGSYSPGLSRRMSSIMSPLFLGGAAAYEYYNNNDLK